MKNTKLHIIPCGGEYTKEVKASFSYITPEIASSALKSMNFGYFIHDKHKLQPCHFNVLFKQVSIISLLKLQPLTFIELNRYEKNR